MNECNEEYSVERLILSEWFSMSVIRLASIRRWLSLSGTE